MWTTLFIVSKQVSFSAGECPSVRANHIERNVVYSIVPLRHANSVLTQAREWRLKNGYSPFQQLTLSDFDLDRDVPVKSNALPGTFLARDNVANFIDWCRRIRIHECLLFETEDLVARKNEKSVVLCLLEVARYGAKFGKWFHHAQTLN